MRIRERIISLLLTMAMLLAVLPAAEAAEAAQPVTGSVSATLRIDYAQSLTALREREITAELLRDGVSLGRLPLTYETAEASLGAYPASVAIRNTDGGALNGGNWPGYLDMTVAGLPQGRYVLQITGRGYVPFRQEIALDRYDQHVILGTGDGSFALGDVDGSGSVDERDRELLSGALGSAGAQDLYTYDLTGDGAIDIYDLACLSRGIRAQSGAEVKNTTLLDPPVAGASLNGGELSGGSLEDLFHSNGRTVTLPVREGRAELEIRLSEAVVMEEIRIFSPEGPGEVLAGSVHVEYEGGFDDIPFDNGLPAGVHGLSAVPGAGVIAISLGRRVAVKSITITVTRTEGGGYASVESIRFLQDIVPENPVQPNSEIRNLAAVPGDERVSLRWGPCPMCPATAWTTGSAAAGRSGRSGWMCPRRRSRAWKI